MMNTSTLFKVMSGLALASVFSLSSCQKEDFMEHPFETESIHTNPLHGQPIPGQYIVVFKSEANGLDATGVQAMGIAGKAVANTLRERMMLEAGVERHAIQQTFEGRINGFAAKLTKGQLDHIRKNKEVAYVEQDRIIVIAEPGANNGKGKGNSGNSGNNGNGNNGNGNGNSGGKTGLKPTPAGPKAPEVPSAPEVPTTPVPTTPEPSTPEPSTPAPTTPEPTTPAPSIPEPATPEEPTPPVQPAPAAFTRIIPAAGENLTWNIGMTGFGDGTGKTVWVIDSGIDTDHPELNVDLQRSASMIYGDNSVEDGFGHGTAVAGIIAAKNNGSGVLGVASNASIVAVRVFDNKGHGTVSRAISAVNYVNNMAKPGDVVNMSLGSGISNTLDNAVIKAASRGILFAIAAGNSATDCSANSPARVNAPGVYTVSAMDRYFNFWSSSSFGEPVDFAAPGVSITSTKIGGGTGNAGSGTSLASPHVAGILLLRGEVFAKGVVNGDKDSWPDPIAAVE